MKSETKKIGSFIGVIPAFNRLAIIFDKNKDYDNAIGICNQAISYYQKYGVTHDTEEFEKRLEKLLTKKAKNN